MFSQPSQLTQTNQPNQNLATQTIYPKPSNTNQPT